MSKTSHNRKPLMRWASLLCVLLLVFGSPSAGQWFCEDGHLCMVCSEETVSEVSSASVSCPTEKDCCPVAPTLTPDNCRDCCEFVAASGEMLSTSQHRIAFIPFDSSLVPTEALRFVPQTTSVLLVPRAHAPPPRSVVYRITTPRAPPHSA